MSTYCMLGCGEKKNENNTILLLFCLTNSDADLLFAGIILHAFQILTNLILLTSLLCKYNYIQKHRLKSS